MNFPALAFALTLWVVIVHSAADSGWRGQLLNRGAADASCASCNGGSFSYSTSNGSNGSYGSHGSSGLNSAVSYANTTTAGEQTTTTSATASPSASFPTSNSTVSTQQTASGTESVGTNFTSSVWSAGNNTQSSTDGNTSNDWSSSAVASSSTAAVSWSNSTSWGSNSTLTHTTGMSSAAWTSVATLGSSTGSVSFGNGSWSASNATMSPTSNGNASSTSEFASGSAFLSGDSQSSSAFSSGTASPSAMSSQQWTFFSNTSGTGNMNATSSPAFGSSGLPFGTGSVNTNSTATSNGGNFPLAGNSTQPVPTASVGSSAAISNFSSVADTSGSASDSQVVSSFTSTMSQNSTTFVTVIRTTVVVQMSSSGSAAATTSELSSASSAASSSQGSSSAASATNAVSTASSGSTSTAATDAMNCDFGVSPVCGPSPTTPAASSEYCLCPFCYLGNDLCNATKPTGTSCPDGWACSITIPSGSSTVWLNLPTGVTWATSTPTPWNETWQTITRTDGVTGTTSVEWTASLSTSTLSRDDGSYIIFPFRVWSCQGSQCGGGGHSDSFSLLKCLLAFRCNTPDNNGWQFPPIPVVPPIGPPGAAPEIAPSTFFAIIVDVGNLAGVHRRFQYWIGDFFGYIRVFRIVILFGDVFFNKLIHKLLLRVACDILHSHLFNSDNFLDRHANVLNVLYDQHAMFRNKYSRHQHPRVLWPELVHILHCARQQLARRVSAFCHAHNNYTTEHHDIVIAIIAVVFIIFIFIICGSRHSRDHHQHDTKPQLASEVCASWTAPFSTTSPAKAGVLNCAAPTDASSTSDDLPWPLVIEPFHPDEAIIKDFCQFMVLDDITIKNADPNGNTSPAQCARYAASTDLLNVQEPVADGNQYYYLVLAVAFDYNGCSSPNDKHKDGISFKDYGADKCRDVLWKSVANKCKFDHAKKMGISSYPAIGGMYWKDCMRWTVVAVVDDHGPPDTLEGHNGWAGIPT
ncbi:hypothetical protein KCU88_g1038, partial [Aureobasidium melanogenum]